ncbi:MAG: hypothetical protein GY861_01510, partial [bacterium]|nr:hypothetical protein [bacterium]
MTYSSEDKSDYMAMWSRNLLLTVFIVVFILVSAMYAIADNPTHKASITGAGSPNYLDGTRSVYVSGNYAYVASGLDNALSVIDISDAANGNIIHKASITGSGSPNYLYNPCSVNVAGDYAYVVSYNDNALTVFDISDVANGNITHKVATTTYISGPKSVFISGDYAYVANYTGNYLSVFDISDVANGNITYKALIYGNGSPNYLNSPASVHVSGNYAYVASSVDDALTVFDISDVANGNITHKASIIGAGSPNYLQCAYSVYVYGNYAYVASIFDDSLSVFDISDVANGNITHKTSLTNPANYLNDPVSVYGYGNYAYVANNWGNSLGVFDVSDVANGNIAPDGIIGGVGSPNYLDDALNVHVSSGYVYVTGFADDALSIFQHGPPIVIFSPLDSAAGVSLDSNITIAFDKAVRNTDDSELTDSNVDALITLKETNASGFNIAFDATINAGKTAITINPTSNLASKQIVYVAIGATVEDDDDISITASNATFTAADITSPTVIFSPLDSATGVSVDSNITITFDEAVRNTDDSALTDSNIDALITLKETNASGSNIAFDATVNAGKTVVTINPTNNLSSEQIVYVAIGATVEDDADNTISASSTTFTAADIINPIVSTLSPADGATAVAVDLNLVITFAEGVDAETGNIYLKKSSDNSTVETFDVTSDISGSGSDTITINPTSNLVSETGYYVQIDTTSFDDSSGNSYAGISDTATWNFTSADVIVPTVTFSPLDSATGVAIDSNVTITFNEAVRNTDDSVLTDSNVDALITLKETNASGSNIAFEATINAGKTVITINPASNLSSEQVVYVAIGA